MKLNALILGGFALALAGCDATDPSLDYTYMPQAGYEKFPIEVAKGKVSAEIKAAHGSLSPSQKESVLRFAQQAQSNAASAVFVREPSGGGHAAAVAGEIAAVLAEGGVSEGKIVRTTYPASSRSPVLVSYVRRYAVTTECGDWSESLSTSATNEVYPNFGCAQQHNIAAMVANPEDFEVPRAMTPSDPMRRKKMFTDYEDARPTTTQPSSTQQISISTVAK